MDLLAVLLNIMRCKSDKKSEAYKIAIGKLPANYKDMYHILMQKGAMYIFMSQFAKRGREGIDLIQKSDLKKKYDDEEDIVYFQRVVIRLTKNHR